MNIYVLKNGAQLGPFSEEQVRQSLLQGQFGPADLGWHEGRAEWTPLHSLISLPASLPLSPAAPLQHASSSNTAWSVVKWVLVVFGGLAVLGLLIGGTMVGMAAFAGSGLDRSSKAYVDDVLPKIAGTWSQDELLKRVAPSFRDKFGEDDTRRLFQKLSGLGSLKDYEGCTGGSKVFFGPGGRSITANYDAKATFENGHATFHIMLIWVDGHWTIGGFHVESPIFYGG